MSNLKKLASDTAIYGVSSIGGRLLNYLLVPFYTEVFETEEYGIVTLLYAFVAFLNVLYLYGLETAYFRFANRYREDEPRIFRTAFTSVFCSSLLLSGTLCLFAGPITDALDVPGKEHYVYWFAAILSIDAIMAIPFARLRLQGRAVKFAAAKLGNIVLNIGLNVFFLVFCYDILEGEYLQSLQPYVASFFRPEWGVDYVFLSNLIANALWIFILFPELMQARFQLDKDYWQQMLVYAYPLLFMGLAGATNEMMSRSLLKYILPENFYPDLSNAAVLGIFGACYKLSIFMNLAIQAFRFASEPFFFSRASDRSSPKLFAQVMQYFVIACCLILFGVSVNLHWLGPLVLGDAEYLRGLEIVPVLLLGYLFFGIYMNLAIWFKLADKNSYGSWFTISGAVLTIILNYTLIPWLGMMGAALATLAVYFYMAVICYYYGQRHYPIPYRLGHSMGYILATSALVFGFLVLEIERFWLKTALSMGLTLLYLIFVFFYEKRHFPVKTT
ncbi:lipopolysaccharide biosynthesis protein [Nafulsella turpanensis]|uniref:lipopolysaccharide biosynthesis protein n=1 Tax=Nafulsella turpanensis TaxID=1265690 RepID=UPI000346C80F|nr:polysaccharide biosynthesis C-terminal domain-containing protein [Nafulsella turpanensis]